MSIETLKDMKKKLDTLIKTNHCNTAKELNDYRKVVKQLYNDLEWLEIKIKSDLNVMHDNIKEKEKTLSKYRKIIKTLSDVESD